MKQTPILVLSDSPDVRSGLARISRDLAAFTASLPEFRVGFLGRGGLGTRQMPVAQYQFDVRHGFGDEDILNRVWGDFAGNAEGVIFAIWDASRLGWLVNWAQSHPKVKLWIYAPVDSAGPNGRLTAFERSILQGFSRVLAYGKFGAEVLTHTLGRPIDWIPHGIQTDVFQPCDKQAARIAMNYHAGENVMGCVMTNQIRKDWATAAATLAEMPEWKAWWHVDTLERHWSLPNLIDEYGLQDRVKVTFTGNLTDTEMSYYYSACDVTMLPSAEGFGLPIAESLACGVPVAHGAYGGGNWGLPTVRYVNPIAFRTEGIFNCTRPVFAAGDWHLAIEGYKGPSIEDCRASVAHLDWQALWPSLWRKWMLAGVQG